jgi:arylsulfatase
MNARHLLAVLLLATSSALAAAPAARPNIVIIMADDMGYSDAGCFGGEIRTPNIDKLAAGGLRFTQFYNNARCCPTRASMLTGQYAHKVGLARNGQSLSRSGITIAEALRQGGYNTAMAGKWHLSFTPILPGEGQHQKWLDHRIDPGVPFAPIESYPINRGFDRHWGIVWGVINYWDPFSLVEGEKPVKEVPDGFHITDAITQKAVEYVKEMSQSEKPFFLYVAHCAPHWPLHAREEDIARYRGKYLDGWNALRRSRYDRMVKMGLVDPATAPLPPLDGQGKPWDQQTDAEKSFLAAKMATHAAMVDRVDQGIGQVIDALKAAGRLENTLIFFFADNGASPEIPTGPGYDRSAETRTGEKIRYGGFAEPGPQTTYTGIGPRWASAANTPLRYWKIESYEGGICTPMVAHWPAGLKAAPGAVTSDVGHVIDLLPTCLEVAGLPYPDEYAGHRLTPLDGKSLVPTLGGQKRQGHERLFFEHEGGRAVRAGDWKLVAAKNSNTWQLFNLAGDRTETRDLASANPVRVAELLAEWEAWADRVGVPGRKPQQR